MIDVLVKLLLELLKSVLWILPSLSPPVAIFVANVSASLDPSNACRYYLMYLKRTKSVSSPSSIRAVHHLLDNCGLRKTPEMKLEGAAKRDGSSLILTNSVEKNVASSAMLQTRRGNKACWALRCRLTIEEGIEAKVGFGDLRFALCVNGHQSRVFRWEGNKGITVKKSSFHAKIKRPLLITIFTIYSRVWCIASDLEGNEEVVFYLELTTVDQEAWSNANPRLTNYKSRVKLEQVVTFEFDQKLK